MGCTIAGETRQSSYHGLGKTIHLGYCSAGSKRLSRSPEQVLNSGDLSPLWSSDWIPGPTYGTLNSCRQGEDFHQKTGAHKYAQAHISAQSPQARQDSRFSRPHENQERRSRIEPSSRHWPQARSRQRRIPRLITLPYCLDRAVRTLQHAWFGPTRHSHEHPSQGFLAPSKISVADWGAPVQAR